MSKKPSDRFEKMTDLETALTAIEQVLAGSSTAPVVLPPPASRLPVWLPWLAALLSLLLLLLTLYLALRTDHGKDSAEQVAGLDLAARMVGTHSGSPDLGSTTPRPNIAGADPLPSLVTPKPGTESKPPTSSPLPTPLRPSKPPVSVKLVISPKKALATVTCAGQTIGCSPGCQASIPASGSCEVTAPGFQPRTLLASKAKRKGTWRIALSKAKR
jgi:hypothetical protein